MTFEITSSYLAPNMRSDVLFAEPNAPSIAAHRVHNHSANIAAFNAPSWPLAALDADNRRIMTIHFSGWPQGFQNFARHVAYALINHGNPESLTEERRTNCVRWLAGNSIGHMMHQLRIQIRWLTTKWSEAHSATPVLVPSDLDSQHLHDLKAWLEQRYTNPDILKGHLMSNIRVWHLNPWLPEDCQWPEPTWQRHSSRLKRGKHENKTISISAPVFSPLLEWAIAFVTEFAPDILGAHSHYIERTTAGPGTDDDRSASSLLDQYALTCTPLPPKPAGVGGKHGNGIGWHVLEYRHGLPRSNFANVYRGWRKASLRIDHDPAQTALDTPILGEFQGQKWISFIGVYDISTGAGLAAGEPGPLLRHLRTACLIIVGALTGMRPEEVLNLKRGCAPEPLVRPGGSRLYLIHGQVFKGSVCLDDGSPGKPRPAAWATIPVAAAAVRTAEKINVVLGRGDDYLFPGIEPIPAHTTTAAGWIESFVEFVNERLAPLTRTPNVFTIPPDPGGPISLRRFRRTLAWFIRHRPNGDITTAIQFQHMGTTVSEGYAGTKQSGMPDLLLEEDYNHRLAMAHEIDSLLSSGGGISGPAAKRAVEATQRLPRLLLPSEERRLRKDKSLVVYDNPAAIALCVFNEATALCKVLTQTEKDTQPDLIGCVEGCPNCARTDDHLDALTLQAHTLREQAELVPIPMAQSMVEIGRAHV